IDEVHMLSRSAFNSMLKTLEEPPQHVKFILATTDPQKVPVTVLSRCLQFNLKQMTADSIVGHLADVLQQENIEFETGALEVLARAARGSMRDSLSLLDQAIAYGGGKVQRPQVATMLGVVDQDYLFNILDALAKQDGAAMMAEADRMQERALSFEEGLQELSVILHQIALRQTVPDALAETTQGYARIDALATTFTQDQVQLNYQICVNGRRDFGLAPDEYAGFTMTLMRMLAFAMSASETAPTLEATKPAPAKQSKPLTTVAPNAAPREADRPAPARNGSALASQASASEKFDGDWPTLVASLQAGGMAQMLAHHAELKNFAGNHFELLVPDEHRHLLDKRYQDKLKTTLESKLGSPVRLSIAIGGVSGSSVAAITDRTEREKQAQAIASIEQDPFVRDLIENMDGKLIESSIKPVN
ncbi:MAG: DNA polymerase III subunit gamma/tau C-terminal domain-containing protein, partial [Burkholderiales bacterium]